METQRKGVEVCEVCGWQLRHIKRHVLRIHVPWYMNPSTACIDCQRSESGDTQLRTFHPGHEGFSGEANLGIWFLLVNGIFLFISQSLELASLGDLLPFVMDGQRWVSPPQFTEEKVFFLREYDR